MQNQQNQMSPMPYYQQKKSKWWIPVVIIGGIFLIIIIFFMSILSSIDSFFAEEPVEVKQNSVLYLNLGESVSELSRGSSLALFGASKPSFYNIIRAIKRAKEDDRINGIYYKASGTEMGYAKNQELIDALADFKKSGKFIIAFIETGTEADYFRALPADKIFMPTEGMMEMNGFGITGMFFKGLFNKLGIDFYVEHFEDFKSFGEMYNRTNFSDSAKKQLRDILSQRYNVFVESVSKYRNIPVDKIKNILDRGVYTADSLYALGFVDSLVSESNVREMVKEMAYGKMVKDLSKNNLRLVKPGDYLSSEMPNKFKPKDTKPKIAIIYASGAIVQDGQTNPFSDESYIKPSEIVKYLKKAREDKNIQIIILRIDSPGGSVIASDEIWSEIIKTKKVKPVFASMSDVAASGGYYIAVACDTIIAEKNTITGSIGVVSAIPNISGLLNKLDITVDTLKAGESSQDLSVMFPFSTQQKDKLRKMMENVYKRFINKVADGRKKSFDEVRAIAKGRVWTGEQARKLGLVDDLGGMQYTVNLAKKRIGINEDEMVAIKEFPRKRDDFEIFMKLFGKGKDDDDLSLDNKIFNDNLSRGTYYEIYNSMPTELKNQFRYFKTLFEMSKNENVLMALPQSIEIR